MREREGKGERTESGLVRLQTHGGREVSAYHTRNREPDSGSLKGPCEPRPGRHCHCSERAPSGRRGEDMVPSVPGPARSPTGRGEEGGEHGDQLAPLREAPMGADSQKENLPSSGTTAGSQRC